MDPSADEADQESDSPYNYVFNNPIKNNDPDGRIPNIDPPSAKTVLKGAAITAGGIFAASLATGGIVAAGGTATVVGAPKPRVPNASQKEQERKSNDNKCANCGIETTAKDTRSHHYPKRHADGGKETVPVCKECHIYLHK